ncbi:MAG: KH domain-containing protein, partial [Candidatus Cloacimonetes bacterium]|nr:KH domain-containing protein [Candidatus Cloacimonadota bacterium]
MKDLLEFVVKGLVDDPAEVTIEENIKDDLTVYELKVSKSDIGKVIGKKGRTAGAIRTILKAVSTKQGKKVELEII